MPTKEQLFTVQRSTDHCPPQSPSLVCKVVLVVAAVAILVFSIAFFGSPHGGHQPMPAAPVTHAK